MNVFFLEVGTLVSHFSVPLLIKKQYSSKKFLARESNCDRKKTFPNKAAVIFFREGVTKLNEYGNTSLINFIPLGVLFLIFANN